MPAALLAALAATAALATEAQAPWAEAATASGVLGAITLPTPAVSSPGRATLSIGGDYWRGGNFLLPGATSQRTHGGVAFSAGLARYVEAFGSIGLRSTNLFSAQSRQTLVSLGDAALGVKLRLPGQGPLAAALLIEADLPSGIGGVSFRGTGGRAAAMLGYATARAAVSVLAGYRIDNSGKLVRGPIATLPAFALALASYDSAEAGVSLQVPLRYATPTAEVSVDTPVARQLALPSSGHPLRARAVLGFSRLHTDRLPGLSFSAAVQLSLAQTGRLDQRALPTQGYAPDAPWTLLAGMSWSFELPRLQRPRELQWHDPRPIPEAAPRPVTALAPKAKAVLRVTVLDAKTALPLAGAWVSFVEGSDVGATTGPEGHARLEADAGPATIAVARDGFELLTEPVTLVAAEEKKLVVQLAEVAPDATVRGKIVGEDGAPLRASLLLLPSGTLSLPGAPGAEPQAFEGSYELPVQHGAWDLAVFTPGYRATPASLQVRPGETASHDFVLRRIAGESMVRLGPAGVELAQPIKFLPGRETIAPASTNLLAELAQALSSERRALVVIARVDPFDRSDEARDGEAAQRLSIARARAVVELLRAKGVRVELEARGAGLGKIGQPLLELRIPAEPKLLEHARAPNEVLREAARRPVPL